MAFTLFWEPAHLPTKLDSRDDAAEALKKLVESFGAAHRLSPVVLRRNHVMTLRQMGGHGTSFAALADVIDVHGDILVWGKD